MTAGLLLIPLLGAIAAWLIPSERGRPWVLPVVGAVHLVLTVEAILAPTLPSPGGFRWLVSGRKAVCRSFRRNETLG